MEVQREGDGHWRFALGPVEKWIVAVAASVLVSGGLWFANSLTTRLDRQTERLQAVVTQQAVTNGQIATLSAQLADVPALTREMAQAKVQIDRNTQDIKELRQTRGLR
ncbi:hypothetical protein [Marilutibacter spongiae]|nr:hypothetical protein [Lysobacter spongiae]